MAMNFEKGIIALQEQLATAVKRIGELEGSFGYITGQLREVQNFLHHNVDARLTSIEGQVKTGFAGVNARLDKLPAIIAETVGEALRASR